MSIADALEAAADALFVHGRCTGTGMDAEGRLCVRGALVRQYGLDFDEVFGAGGWRVADAALARWLAANPDVIREDVREGHRGCIDEGRFPTWIWNDTTHDDALVIDSLKRCAKELREAGES